MMENLKDWEIIDEEDTNYCECREVQTMVHFPTRYAKQ